ncbi:DUF6089 family protein [Chondrinema litorale]|uniref:type IX secretion system protein PorG n=1 Tax=Chondrinema litorale TaxID=2994555 RepID=UPI002542B8CA|nr:DUF6089 family protein [Chondrinema litorale]UZR94954.1 DUF6089 family protein [Chondrinema litorale]
MEKRNLYKQLLILGLLNIIFIGNGIAQKYEIGFGVGAINYKGDVAPVVKMQNTRPGGNIFFRINFSEAVSLRNGLMLGAISGSDEYQNDPFLQQRNFGFKSLLTELNSVIEYNFFDFRKDIRRQSYTPYIFAGLGISANFLTETTGNAPPPNSSVIHAVIPFGVGIKKALNDKFTIAAEFSTSKTFSDNTDLIVDNDSGPRITRVSRTDLDSYYYLNFTLSYRFISLLCPEHLNVK